MALEGSVDACPVARVGFVRGGSSKAEVVHAGEAFGERVSLMQVSEAFQEAGITPVPTEGDFRLKCDECDSMQRLQDMERSDVAGVTIYACRSCGRKLVGVKSFK